MQFSKTFFIAFSTLLPVIAPMGASLETFFPGGLAPDSTYRILARRVAINNIILLSIIEVLGSAILTFFGISIPIIEIAGGAVIIAIGWQILHQCGGASNKGAENVVAREPKQESMPTLSQKTFYPFTFPIDSGPGAIVAMLTLSARPSSPSLSVNLFGHIGIFLALVVVSAMSFLCCIYAPKLAQHVGPSTVQMSLRLISFITVAIGIQFVWTGMNALLLSVRPFAWVQGTDLTFDGE